MRTWKALPGTGDFHEVAHLTSLPGTGDFHEVAHLTGCEHIGHKPFRGRTCEGCNTTANTVRAEPTRKEGHLGWQTNDDVAAVADPRSWGMHVADEFHDDGIHRRGCAGARNAHENVMVESDLAWRADMSPLNGSGVRGESAESSLLISQAKNSSNVLHPAVNASGCMRGVHTASCKMGTTEGIGLKSTYGCPQCGGRHPQNRQERKPAKCASVGEVALQVQMLVPCSMQNRRFRHQHENRAQAVRRADSQRKVKKRTTYAQWNPDDLTRIPRLGGATRKRASELLGPRRRFKDANGLLCIQMYGLWRIWVPECKQYFLYRYHDHPTAGHMGVTKTYDSLAIIYYWPGIMSVFSKNTCPGPRRWLLPQGWEPAEEALKGTASRYEMEHLLDTRTMNGIED
ncbi:hypothetical protein Efla_004038 [Eimeria flavescens]